MPMRRWLGACAALAVATVAWSAHAHELVCEKTVDGETFVTVDRYPTTLSYKVTVTNVHPTDESVVLTATDTLQSLDFELPLTLAVGASAEQSYQITLTSYDECVRLAGGTNLLENVFTIGWDLGTASCTAQVECQPEVSPSPSPTPSPSGGATRTMGFFKTHESALSQCLAGGTIDLGFLSVSTLEDALGLLWGSPREFADGTPRTGLDKFRFLLARQTLVAICNVRLFGTSDDGLISAAVSALATRDCGAISSLESQVDAFNNSGDSVAFPTGFAPGPATPTHAKSIANDPTSPSGLSCQ
jgi:hypothetical protein